MDFKTYVENTRRTWNNLEHSQDNINHALLGMCDEIGEISSQYKGNLAYGRPLLVNEGKGCVKEEIGDLVYFIARLIDELKFDNSEQLFKDIDNIIDTQEIKIPEGTIQINVVLNIAYSASTVYGAVASGKGEDIVNSVSQLIYLTLVLADMTELNFRDILETNINKLKVRFPEKFSNEKANNRDLNQEEKVINGNE